MRDQIKHESVKAWLEFTRSNPKKLRKIMRKIVITFLHIQYSIWCIKNSKTKEYADKKTFYKYIASETMIHVDEWCWLERLIKP